MSNTHRDNFGSTLRKHAAALFASAAIAGCAGVPSGMQAPAVTISDFRVGSVSLLEQQFDLKLRIQNPNRDELTIDGIAFDLEINGERFAQGVGNQGVTVPGFGSAFLAVEAVSSLGGLIRQFSAATTGEKPEFRYRIYGSMSVAGGTRIAFDRGGRFDFAPGRAR